MTLTRVGSVEISYPVGTGGVTASTLAGQPTTRIPDFRDFQASV
jgi:hypothetical protein